MKGLKTVYICSECEYKSPKWMGKCPSCGAWNSFAEDVEEASPASASVAPKRISMLPMSENNRAVSFCDLEIPEYMRQQTGLNELDRVLGGGLVHGSVVLLSGEPGIGKSTLLLQICDALGTSKRVLYISGEESGGQLKLRANRLGVVGNNLSILTETNIENILKECDKVKPDVMIVDSIQTIYSAGVNSAPGSVSQVRETALSFINKAKSAGMSVIMVGHVNKEGSIAGPKVLEHMVDAVLYFEGERNQAYRIIRAIKWQALTYPILFHFFTSKKSRRDFESTVSMEHANEVFPIRKDRSNPCGSCHPELVSGSPLAFRSFRTCFGIWMLK